MEGFLGHLCGFPHQSCLFPSAVTQTNQIVLRLILEGWVFGLQVSLKLARDHGTV